jgi:hypothetical protein
MYLLCAVGALSDMKSAVDLFVAILFD